LDEEVCAPLTVFAQLAVRLHRVYGLELAHPSESDR
jgi:hypothetical protein